MAQSPIDGSHSLFGVPGLARRATIWLIIVTFAYRLIGAGAIDLVLGEAYYASSARQLHLSYFDQPPISLWIIWAARNLFNTEQAWLLRLPFVLIFVPVTWLVYRIGARVRSEWAGFFAALVMNVSILFTVSIGSWLQPDAPLMLFWLLAVWVLIPVFFDDLTPKQATRQWIWAGIWLGLAFISKYHAVLLVAGVGLFMLTSADARKWFFRPGPYLGVLIAFVVSLPVIAWNAANDWVSFGFQGERALAMGFHPDWLIRMILGQIVYVAPWLAFPIYWASGVVLAKGPRGVFPKDTQPGLSWFLLMLGLPPILFFTAVAAWHDTQFHFHWQAPGYMMLFVLLGAWIDAAWTRHRRLIVSWLAISAVLSFGIITVLMTHTANGWLRNVLPDGKSFEDPTAGAIEWRELGEWFDKSGITQTDAFVVGLNWMPCGQIDTPLAGRLPLACFSSDPRNIAFNIDLGDMVGRDAYIVMGGNDLQEVEQVYGQFFDGMELLQTLDIRRAGFVEIHDIGIVKGFNFHMDRAIPVAGEPKARILRLPRTRITALSGAILGDGTERDVQLLLDDAPIGNVALMADTETPFSVQIENPVWSVGNAKVKLKLRDTVDGDKQDLALTRLEVRVE